VEGVEACEGAKQGADRDWGIMNLLDEMLHRYSLNITLSQCKSNILASVPGLELVKLLYLLEVSEFLD
jgi:hypothetical protein